MMKCPNCGYERQRKDDDYQIVPPTECPKCGIIYDKWHKSEQNKDMGGRERNGHPSPRKGGGFSSHRKLTGGVAAILAIIAFISMFYLFSGHSSRWKNGEKNDKSQTSLIVPAPQSVKSTAASEEIVSSFPPQPAPRSFYPDSSPDLPALYRKAAGAVVLINTERGRGTGFIVENGAIITNNHVIAGPGEIKVKTSQNRGFAVSQILARDVAGDLAVLAAPELSGEKNYLLFSYKKPEIGERIFVVSNPLTLEKSLSEGIIAGIRESSAGKLYQITAPISSGSSGGPVCNMQGEVVCIVTSVMAAPGGAVAQNLNMCIPGERAVALLRGEASLSPKPPPRRVYCTLLNNGTAVITETPQTVSSYTLISHPDGSLDKETYEKWAFEKIGGNPFIFDPAAAAQSSLDRDREEIFKMTFPHKKPGEMVTAGEQKFFYDRINQIHKERYNRAVAWQNRAKLQYNYLMNVFNEFTVNSLNQR